MVDPRKQRRLELVVVAIVNVAFPLPLLLTTIFVLLEPSGDWTEFARVAAPAVSALILAFYFLILWTLVGSGGGAKIAFALAVAISGLFILQSALVISSWAPTDNFERVPWATLIQSGYGFLAVPWLILNYRACRAQT